MPRNIMSDFSGMVCEAPPQCQLSGSEKNSHPESGRSHEKHRSSTWDDDESLKYLTHEEKDVLLFFEETIDSLEHDLEDQDLHDSGIHCHSPGSTEENVSSQSESEDIIDLVQPMAESRDEDDGVPSGLAEPALEGDLEMDKPAQECSKLLDVTGVVDANPVLPSAPALPIYEMLEMDKPAQECSKLLDVTATTDAVDGHPMLPSAPALPVYEMFPAAPAVQHPKLFRSIPTPLVIAQKISEKQAEGSLLSPTSPKVGRSVERRTTGKGEHFIAFRQSVPPPTAPKPQKFPSNISITNMNEREFSKTISNAAVNVQERKAWVLANVNGLTNIHGSAFLMSELEQKLQKQELLGHSRSSSLKDLISEQARHSDLSKLSLVEETLNRARLKQPLNASVSKDDKPEGTPTLSNGYQNIHDILKREPSPFPSVSKTVAFKSDPTLAVGKPAKSFYEPRQPDFSVDMRKRSVSLPRPSGLRPQGVTVQFSGRGSTEEARREALRKLGLLKE